MSLTQKQVDKALSISDFDCWYDSAGEFFVHLAHSKEGVYLLIVDIDCATVYTEMSFYCSYLWMAAMNAREWPRTGKATCNYIVQRKLEKVGDKYRVYKRSPKNKSAFKKNVREFEGFLSIPIRQIAKGDTWRKKNSNQTCTVDSVTDKWIHYLVHSRFFRSTIAEFKKDWEIIRQ